MPGQLHCGQQIRFLPVIKFDISISVWKFRSSRFASFFFKFRDFMSKSLVVQQAMVDRRLVRFGVCCVVGSFKQRPSLFVSLTR